LKPIILLNCEIEEDRANLRLPYADAVYAAGGIPLVFAPPADPVPERETLDRVLDLADGAVFVGADDYHPRHYGEEPHPDFHPVAKRRERSDLLLARAVLAAGLPVLAVCGGAQLIAIASGGACVQHLGSAGRPSPHADGARHDILVEEDSLLARVLAGVRFTVNSFHHQAIHPERPGTNLRIAARAEPSILPAVEAVEAVQGAGILAVQWHPEKMLEEPAGSPLFAWLVSAAAKGRSGRKGMG
jgi:putative glutamine amidotransferase